MKRTENSSKLLGMTFAAGSAVIFGCTPLLTSGIYLGGSNGVTAAFLRAALGSPILLVLVLCRRQPLLPTLVSRPALAGAGILSGITSLLLYTAYEMIPTSVATSIHFVYPVTVAILSAVFLKKKLSVIQCAGLVLGTTGIFAFMIGADMDDLAGMCLALASGITFGGYIVLLDTKGIGKVGSLLLAFWISVIAAAIIGIYAVATGRFWLPETPQAWGYAFLLVLCTTLGATMLLQIGVRLCGATNGAILSLLEPVTSVFIGTLVLKEELSPLKILGSTMTLSSLLMMTVLPRIGRRGI